MSLEEGFEFIFEDKTKFVMLKQDLIEISPNLYTKVINNSTKIITVPKYIKYNDFKDFTEIFQSYISRLRQFNQETSFISINLIIKKYKANIAHLIQISEFFQNSSFSKILIKECVFAKNKEKDNTRNINHTLNINNSVLLLHLSFNKLRELNSSNKSKKDDINIEEDLENIWFELFMRTLDIIGKNLDFFFSSKNNLDDYSHNQLRSLDQKIIDEILEKFSYNLISRNFKVKNNINEIINLNLIENKDDTIELNILEEIVNFLIQQRNQKDFFYLLSNEYFRIISEENINELNSLPNPTFVLKININDIDNYYEEYSLNDLFSSNDNFKLILIVYYKKNEDSFNVAIKLSKINNKNSSSFDIMTFLSLAMIEELNNKQINVKTLSNNKSMYEIFKINNFKKSRNSNSNNNESKIQEYFTFKLFLKPCYIYILLSNYLFYNLENLSNNENLSKLNKNLLSIIISKKYINKNEENEEKINNSSDIIVEFLINWLNDEINIVEDISDIIKNIKWENVSLPKLFEFFIKYSSNVPSDDIEYIFSKSLLKILKKYDGTLELLSHEILKALTVSSNKINYISMFTENKKIKKFNLFELISQRRYIYSELNSKNNEKKYKTTNNSFFNTIDKKENDSYSKTRIISKNNSNYKKLNKFVNKRQILTCKERSPIKLKEEISSKNKDAKDVSFNSSNICYNNYYSNYNNNFNINIRLDNKFKALKKHKIIHTRKNTEHKVIKKKNKNEFISRNNKNRINDLSSISRTKQKEQNSSYINTINLKRKLENLYHKTNLNQTINIKNLKLLQNKIMNKQKDININKNINYFSTKRSVNTKNNKSISVNQSSSFNNYDRDNPEKRKISQNKIDKKDNNRRTIKKNIFKLKEILKIGDKDKKQNHLKFNLKSLKSGIKK